MISKKSFLPENPVLIKKLALWERTSIPTCTNHIESIHSKINKRLAGNNNFVTGIQTIFEYIHQKFLKIGSDSQKAVKKEIQRIEVLSKSKDIIKSSECDCLHFQRLNQKYGMIFPCPHTFLYWKNNNIAFPEIKFPVFSSKNEKSTYIEMIMNDDHIEASFLKEKFTPMISEHHDFDKFNRSGKNFMNAVYSIAHKHQVDLKESELFCSSVLFCSMKMSLKDLSHPVTNAKFYVRCWNDDEGFKLLKDSLMP